MNYFKKTIALKKTSSEVSSPYAIARLEKENDKTTLSLSLMNFSANGQRVFVCVSTPVSHFVEEVFLPLSNNILLSDIDISLPVAVCIASYNGEKTFPLLFGTEETFTSSENCALLINKKVLPAPTYDDEIIATENYYLYEKEDYDKQTIGNENTACASQPEEEKITCSDKPLQDEINYRSFGKKGYYESVKEDLELLLEKSEKEVGLEKTIPNSRFCKINYSADKYYVVGVVFENGQAKYVCYGVPAKYSPTPPSALNGCSCFMPISIFDLCGDGYFMMFQDAVTGECKSFG